MARKNGINARAELGALGACLLIGVVALPLLIWIAGRSVLGPYAHGSALALWWDFLRGLSHLWLPFWAVALGPYALYALVRLWRSALRH